MSNPAPQTARVTISMPNETADWLADHAWRTRRSVSEVCRDMIEAVRKEADNPHTRRLREETTEGIACSASST